MAQKMKFQSQKLVSQTFTFIGDSQFSSKREWCRRVREHGGSIEPSMNRRVNIVVLLPKARQRIDKIRKDAETIRPDIKVIDEREFLTLLAPRRDEAISMLRGGKEGLQEWSRIYETASGQEVLVPMPNLKGICLVGEDLTSVPSVRLRGACLDDARMSKLKCRRVEFGELNRVDLSNSHLVSVGCERMSSCKVTKSKLHGFSINPGVLNETDLSGSTIDESLLSGVKCNGTRFIKTTINHIWIVFGKYESVDFSDAEFFDSELGESSFHKCSFHRTRFFNVKIEKVRFKDCDFSGAVFTACSFAVSDLRDADLRKATLEGCNLGGAKLKGAKLPAGAEAAPRRFRGGPNLRKLAKIGQQSKLIRSQATIRLPSGTETVVIEYKDNAYYGVGFAWSNFGSITSRGPVDKRSTEAMGELVSRFGRGELVLDSVKVTDYKSCPVSKADLREIFLAAWSEAFPATKTTVAGTTRRKKK